MKIWLLAFIFMADMASASALDALRTARSPADVARAAMAEPGERVTVVEAGLALGLGSPSDISLALLRAGATPEIALTVPVRAAPHAADRIALVMASVLLAEADPPHDLVVEEITRIIATALSKTALSKADRAAEMREVEAALRLLERRVGGTQMADAVLLDRFSARQGDGEGALLPPTQPLIIPDTAANAAPSAN